MKTAEPDSLKLAREHLAQAEAEFRNEDGLHHLEEGLALVQDVVIEGETQHREVAENLLKTYTGKICDAIRLSVNAHRQLPEPELKHLFAVLLAFDTVDADMPDYARTLKIDVVKRLIDLHYEGYPEAEKQKMLEQLAGIAR